MHSAYRRAYNQRCVYGSKEQCLVTHLSFKEDSIYRHTTTLGPNRQNRTAESNPTNLKQYFERKNDFKANIMVIIAAMAVTAASVGIVTYGPALLGFTKAGIVAGSTAAAMMSSAAVSAGGGVAAGGIVATLQSIGAAGVGATGYAVSGVIGAVSGYFFGR